MRKATFQKFILGALTGFFSVGLVACNPPENANRLQASPVAGLWLAKSEADDIRSMGRLAEEPCAAARAQEMKSSRRALRIDQFGAIYVYNPIFAATASPDQLEKTKIGIVDLKAQKNASSAMPVVMTNYQYSADLTTMVVSLSTDQSSLLVNYTMKNATELETYVKTTEDELLARNDETKRCISSK